MIHLYGVVQELRELPSGPGVDDAALERRWVGELELVVSRAGRELPEVSEEAVLRHAHVVEELMERSRAVLPAQFGRAFADDDELARAVETKAAELERSLDRVGGCVEFGLRVLDTSPPGSKAKSPTGADYLKARLEELRQRDGLADEVHQPLAGLSRASVKYGGAPPSLLEAAYLVPENRVEAFRDEALRLEAAHPEVSVVCTGPWPPYSFAFEREESE